MIVNNQCQLRLSSLLVSVMLTITTIAATTL